jgi:hypothetical protein
MPYTDAYERQAEVMKQRGIDEEYAKAWWSETEEMISDKVACNLDIQTMVLQILGYTYVPVKSKNYTLLTDVKKLVENRLNEDGISVKITLKKLKEIMKTCGFKPVEGGGNKVWLIQVFSNNAYRVGWN